MIIKKAEVEAKTTSRYGTVTLHLCEMQDGWSYEVTGMTGENLPMNWRAKTRLGASEKLLKIYKEDTWVIRILEKG